MWYNYLIYLIVQINNSKDKVGFYNGTKLIY
nr:MAG TPA: hypothetical protein [Caudoviricetes sp.]